MVIFMRRNIRQGCWRKDKREQLIESILKSSNKYTREQIVSAIEGKEKLIIEYTFGYGGKPQLEVKDIAMRIGKPEVYVRRKRQKIGEKVNNAKRMWLL